uniref:C-type lectin domain-containing protein n=1 Tax=Caenorhabditis tropicalis TaxID=1561998 RepID=A0A1I7TX61_9PELO
MASFHSQAESIFVANKYTSIHAWTGLSQTEIPNTWTYTDGTPDWHWFPTLTSAPSDADHSCVEMMDGLLGLLFAFSLQKGQTNPYSCSEVNQILCKYCPRETTSTPSTTTTVTTTTTTTTPTTTTTKVTTPTTITTKTPTTSITTTTKTTTQTVGTPSTSTKTTTKPTTTTPKAPSTCDNTCVSPTVNFNNKCYKMCSGLVKFEDACSWCGGTTVIISNKEENDFISRTFGSNDQKISQVWIGNSESNGYLNWENEQPSKPNNGVDYCISMDLSAGPTRGKYKYLPCQNTVSHSICLMNS